MPIFDCEFQHDPVCPYCGKKQSDAWELNLSDGEEIEVDCQNCELTFTVKASITIDYTTKPVNPADVLEYCTANNLEIPECVK